MKRLFKLFLIFFALTAALLFEPASLHAQPIDNNGYIQNIKTETVALISNNVLNAEISSVQEENNQSFSGTTPLIITYYANGNLLNKNKTQLNGCFIHNLSANKQKVHQIRAP